MSGIDRIPLEHETMGIMKSYTQRSLFEVVVRKIPLPQASPGDEVRSNRQTFC